MEGPPGVSASRAGLVVRQGALLLDCLACLRACVEGEVGSGRNSGGGMCARREWPLRKRCDMTQGLWV